MKRQAVIITSLIILSLTLFTACGSAETDAQNSADAAVETSPAEDTAPEEDAAETPSVTDTASEENDTGNQADEEALFYLQLSEGDAAPDFTATLADGTEFTLSEQQGKVVLLNFWATWCGPCVREMPAFEKLQEDYGDNVAILAVNCMEDADTVAAFIEENSYTFPIAIDERGAVSAKYPTQGIPYTLVIDGDGIVQNIYMGAADADTQYEEYKSAVDAIVEAVE